MFVTKTRRAKLLARKAVKAKQLLPIALTYRKAKLSPRPAGNRFWTLRYGKKLEKEVS